MVQCTSSLGIKMAVWSRFLSVANSKLFPANVSLGKVLSNCRSSFQNQAGSTRCMSEHRVIVVTPSRWQWHKTKDFLHFYFLVGAIPAALLIFYTNVFIGPATLTPIPEGYTPKRWEYYRHPISRFIAKYLACNPQQEYEKLLHYKVTSFEKARLFKLEHQILEYTQKYNDYKHWSFQRAMTAKYIRQTRDRLEERELH